MSTASTMNIPGNHIKDTCSSDQYLVRKILKIPHILDSIPHTFGAIPHTF